MDNKPKISVIVPVYNNEGYLRECVDSLIGQTLKEIEILLIDDGSTDQSGALCDSYAQEDPRIRVIHKMNEGLGLTRNRGLTEAAGEYFTFVDSDDYVAINMYERLWEQARKHDADACICGSTRVVAAQKISFPLELEKEVYTKEEIQKDLVYRMIGAAPEDVQENRLGYSMCTGIFRLSIVKDHDLVFFSEREFKMEDILFKIAYFSHIERLTYIEDSCYMYRFNTQSLTNTFRRDLLEATVKSYQKEFELLEQLGYELGWIFAARMFLADVRGVMRSIMQHSGFWRALGNYRQIAGHPFVQEVLARYPYNRNPRGKRIFNYLLHRKMTFLLAVMVKGNLAVRSMKDG